MSTKRDQLQLLDMVADFKGYSDAQMVDYVHARYPYFSIRSEWGMGRAQQRAARLARSVVQRNHSAQLYTLGYEGRSIDRCLDLWTEHNIRLLCDVRRNPLSMKYGFSKRQLAGYCENLDIAYVHIPQLGIESKKRRGLASERDYARLFSEYSGQLPTQADALGQLRSLLGRYERAALMCFEGDYRHCHRHCISDYLQRDGIQCQHL